MKIIRERAEEKLAQRLRIGSALSNSRHALHIRGRPFSGDSFDALPELVTGWIGHDSGEIYICHDRDIFAFSFNLSPGIFNKFKERFQTHFEYETEIQAQLLSFYDLALNGLALAELAETKLEKKRITQRKEREKKEAEIAKKVNASVLGMIVDEELVSTLKTRRKNRILCEILIVEDDPFSRKLIRTALDSGFNMTFAEDGHAAIVHYLQKAPDIVFLDIDLPDVTGHDVLAKILSFDPDAYIVMLSGNSQIENVRNTVHAGAKGFIGKPFTKEKLLQYITRHPKNQLEHTGV